jgi:hypothetical protein
LFAFSKSFNSSIEIDLASAAASNAAANGDEPALAPLADCSCTHRVQKQSAKGASAGAAAVAAAADAKSISMDELKDLLKANNLDHTGLKQ